MQQTFVRIEKKMKKKKNLLVLFKMLFIYYTWVNQHAIDKICSYI